MTEPDGRPGARRGRLDRLALPPPGPLREDDDGRRRRSVARRPRARGARPGSRGPSASAPTSASSREAVRIASLDDLPVEVLATVGLHPHEASTSTRGLADVLDAAGGRAGGRRSGSAASTTTTSTRRATPSSSRSRDQLALAVDRDLAVVLHVRDAFDDLFARARRRRRARRGPSCTASRRAPRRRDAAWTRAWWSRSRASSRSRTPRRCATRSARCPLDRLSSRPTARSSPRCRIAGSPNEPALRARSWARRWPRTLNLDLDDGARGHVPQRLERSSALADPA